jgi:predicted methyltransferase
MPSRKLVVISRFQARPLLDARRSGSEKAAVSLDLGLTEEEVALGPDGVALPDGRRIPWPQLEEVAANETACFALVDGALEKVQRYSRELSRIYTLYPTAGAPTMLISGIPMHRIKDIDPWEDTRRKLRAASVTGTVLDTATGLGYTAIQAARTARRVVTIELDPEVLELARLNPWSQRLFSDPKIEQLTGDSFEVAQSFSDDTFDAIIHDPPVISLAGDLYSAEFYRHLLRVLKPGGRLFHYIGDPDSRTSAGVTRGVLRRLKEAGFRRVTRRPEAFGAVAQK